MFEWKIRLRTTIKQRSKAKTGTNHQSSIGGTKYNIKTKQNKNTAIAR